MEGRRLRLGSDTMSVELASSTLDRRAHPTLAGSCGSQDDQATALKLPPTDQFVRPSFVTFPGPLSMLATADPCSAVKVMLSPSGANPRQPCPSLSYSEQRSASQQHSGAPAESRIPVTWLLFLLGFSPPFGRPPLSTFGIEEICNSSRCRILPLCHFLARGQRRLTALA